MELKWDREFALEQVDGDEEFLNELVGFFIDTTESDLEKLKASIDGGDNEGARQAAHSIKGAAGNLGFQGMWERAREVEELCREGALGEAREGLEDLKSLLIQVKALIE